LVVPARDLNKHPLYTIGVLEMDEKAT